MLQLDRTVISLMLFLFAQTGGAVWWAATLTARVKTLTELLADLRIIIATGKSPLCAVHDQRLSDIERRLQKLEESSQ